jgi:endonuclease/exonuclease/phosphatase family metal-dependent hydrolase
MRVVSANLLFGMSLSDGTSNAERMCASLRELRPDVLGIQEVDRNQSRSMGIDQTQCIAESLGAADYRFVPAIIGEPGGQWRPANNDDRVSEPYTSGPETEPISREGQFEDSPAYGIGLILRVPALRWHTMQLTGSRVVSPIMMPGTKKVIWLRDEPRVLVAAEIEPTPTSPFRTIATTHLSFVPGVNVRQLRQVKAALKLLPGPRLLLGDLNLPGPPARLVMRGWTSLLRAPTYPSPDPKIQFDHFFTDATRMTRASEEMTAPIASQATVEEMAFSDHRAILLDTGNER